MFAFQNGDTALHVAAASGHGAIVQALVNAKADCSIINGEGNTCLHLAAGASVAAVKRLLVAGAPVNAQNKVCLEPQWHHCCCP